jgi:hypothetical protein
LELRVVVAVVCAAAVSWVAWGLIGNNLSVRTDIVGATTFYAFDIYHYLDQFYVVVIVLPALASILFLFLGRWGPLAFQVSRPAWPPLLSARDAAPPFRGSDGEAASPKGAQSLQVDQDAFATRPRLSPLELAGVIARLALPALVIAAEIEIGWSPTGQALTLAKVGGGAGAIYVGTVLAVALLFDRRRHHGVAALSAANALIATAVVPMLLLVSASTAVLVSSDNRVVHYPWLPTWLAGVTATAILAIVALALKRGGLKAAHRVERWVLIATVAPVALFLATALLQGAQGALNAFDDSQSMVGAQLMFAHGLWPWKDVFLLHGFLADGFDGALGMWAFGATRWGSNTGLSFFVTPVTVICLCGFIAYFARRNWALVVGGALVLTLGLLQNPDSARYVLLPVVLILFDMVLRRDSWRRCWLFMAVIVLTAIVTPEATILVVGVLVTLGCADLVHHRWGQPFLTGFRRTLRCAVAGTALTALWVIFLLATGALSGFVDYYTTTVTGHELWGALAIAWPFVGDINSSMWFALPIALFLLTVAKVVWKLERRSEWRTAEWTLVASATFVPLFYQVVLDRYDAPHVEEVAATLIPFVFLWGLEAVSAADHLLLRIAGFVAQWMSRRRLRKPEGGTGSAVRGSWGTTTPVAVAVVIGVLLCSPQSLALVKAIPSHFHPTVPTEAPTDLPLGYTWPGSIDTTQLDDLAAVINRYAGASGPVVDFANEMGVTYYLLDRVPGAPFLVISSAETAAAQQVDIDALRQSRPPVAIFNDTTFGLTDYDGIWSMERDYLVSQYLLDNYRPILDVEGQIVMLRDDLVNTAPPPPTLQIAPVTTGLYFAGEPSCAWGDVPDFFDPPTATEISVGVAVPTAADVPPATMATSTTLLSLAVPGTLTSYQWLEFSAPSGFGRATIKVTDQTLGAQASHVISFETLPRVGSTVFLRVGSCIQWHGYSAGSLHLLLQGAPTDMTVWALP